MSAKKNRICSRAIIFSALLIFIAGCTPPGPRALLKGKKFLERGDYSSAVEQLKTATTILSTNAQAWNYYGVALQHAGQPDDAAAAYERALTLDRDLTEAHYNLGCLDLEQNKLVDAKTELTAYTLRRSNTPEGWLKLGDAQLRSGEIAPAEKSFSTAYYMNTNNPEALNGFGLARIARGRPREAAQFFAAAIKRDPGYAPAILNLATVNAEYFHDNKTALDNYRAYLALTPRHPDWDDVSAIADNLEQSSNTTAANLPQENQPVPLPPLAVSETKTQATSVAARLAPPKMQAVHTPPQQSAKIQPEQQPGVGTVQPLQTPQTPGTVHNLNPLRWFNPSPPDNYSKNGVTPLPVSGNDLSKAAVVSNPPVEPAPAKIISPAPPVFPRYAYLSPRKPKAGDRTAASAEFEKARASELDSRLADAAQSYQKAAQLDPAWFEAQYNYSVLEYRLRNFRATLAACETALAIQPDSADARYTFGLALKASGYITDAVNELKKVVASNADNSSAHLALGDIYAQQLHDTANARLHYLKFLDLDPRNSQATNVRFWLASNPQ